jgi:intracellular sulfur oxidation DsrE/DsrF family protein
MKIFKTNITIFILASTAVYADAAKVVYDLTSNDIQKIKKHLIHSVEAVSEYYQSEKKEFKAIVVISGDAYQFFVEDLKNSPYADKSELKALQSELKPLFEKLHAEHNVTFNMCETGMDARDIKIETLYKFVNAEMMKSVYLINAQNDGYAYMPIH